MRPKTLLRIARWEATKGFGGLDRGAVAVGVAAVAFVLAVGVVGVVGGVAIEDGIYRVGVEEDSDLYGPVADDPAFAAVEPNPEAIDGGGLAAGGRYDLYVEDRPGGARLYLAESGGEPTEKSRAALAALRGSIDRYNDRRLSAEDNASAAFPVTVTVRYVERGGSEVVAAGDAGDASGADDGDSTTDGGAGGTDGSSGGGATGSDGGTTGTDTETTQGATGGDTEGPIGAPSLGAFDLFGTAGTTGTPSDIQPPFPFQSLVLAFLFVLPLNFLIQAYGSSMLSERLGRRGELLLVAPVGRADIVFGKTLPYAAASVSITVAIVAGLRLLGGEAGLLSVLAVAPLTLLFLATTFLGSLFARSFKELTFVTVTITTLLTTYAFVPAIFAETSAVAFVSPLTLAIKDLTGTAVTPGQFAFALGPPTLVGAICFFFGLGLYREEDLFTQRAIQHKALDALAERIRRPRSVAAVVVLLVPFVFVAELFAVALLFALPVAVSIPLVFAVIAVIEELAKGLPIYAGFAHDRYGRTLPVSLAVGAAAGIGFFLAEKLTLAVQLVGLPGSPVADAAFQTGFGAPTPGVIALLAFAPLALHVATSTVTAAGASRGRSTFVLGLCSAVLVHVAYNAAVVSRVV
ncbi:PrsW family glutamic-type intramembrane protease [Natronomonas sp.]|uniref:PrsW family glutamic-type intramembrane protease n=1 Tax=Natronomonas sp. TaxID=2184060 RepID=UPI00262AD312|nr:PrsW family glutamic-type intramembrane protease [Natronomonas sp.]